MPVGFSGGPQPLLPNQPAGVPDWYSPTGTASTAPAASGTRPRFYATDNGPVTLPSDFSDQDAQQWVTAYNQYIAKLTESAAATSGLQRKQIEAQIADAARGRDNAMQIAQLQSDTSRYGTDANKETQLAQLKQQQQQFNATHALALQQFGLSQQQFGLDAATSYAKNFASTPDMRWSANDFDSAIARGNQGLGPRPIGANPDNPNAPVPKSYDDFAVLANYGPGGPGTGVGGGASGSAGQGATNANGGPATPTGTGSTTDPRLTAANAVMKALPPSDGVGHDGQDWAALGAIKNLYFGGGPGSVERLGAARQKIANTGLARLGLDPALVNQDYQRRGIGQGSPLAS